MLDFSMKAKGQNSIKPFWSWNDRLEKNELEKQIVQMKNNGIDGFFMHARGGLKTEYMSDEWFEMIGACLDKADELGMHAWAYDENGWPSGFGDGLVPALGHEHQQKYLQYAVWDEEKESGTERNRKIFNEYIIAMYQRAEDGFHLTETLENGVYVFYYEVNPYYVDVFNRETIAQFLKLTYEKYYERFKERFGSSLQGFFTDEPQFHVSPWSLVFPEEFKKAYGYDLKSVLPMLFFEEAGYEAVRNDFQEMVSRLFRENFIKQMYDWCTEHNCKLTGHMMSENNLHSQMCTTNGVMACYEYFHEPGMDHLRRKIASPQQPKQLGSVAAQLGRKTLTETFALCGWDVSLNELKWIAQWQYVNGVTSLCPHLEGYSIRGTRKRDYPASLFTQLPWFDAVYRDFAKYFTTLGALLDEGTDIAPLLVIHPMHSAYILHDSSKSEELLEYSKRFEAFTMELNDAHILHHYGDEIVMEHHARVQERQDSVSLIVGKCEYRAVLLPNLINLTDKTVKLLSEFAKKGGGIYAIGALPFLENGRKTATINKLCGYVKLCKDLGELKRKCPQTVLVDIIAKEGDGIAVHLNAKEMADGGKLLYLVNNILQNQEVILQIKGEYEVWYVDILKDCKRRLSAEIKNGKTVLNMKFAEYGSTVLLLYEGGSDFASKEQEKVNIILDKKFNIISCDDNAITLDKCTYRIDGGVWQPEIAVINLQNKLLELQKPCHVDMQFPFQIGETFAFESVKLCMEVPEKFKVAVNGVPYNFKDSGMFIDHTIRQSNIGDYLKVGSNTISLSCDFTQSPEVYYAKCTPEVHESVRNKLTYDTELESIYLIGKFGVHMEEEYTIGERRCLHGGQHFELVKLVNNVDITEITHQGFWFFSGKMVLSQKVSLYKAEGKQYVISLKHLNAPAAQVYVNGTFAGNMIFAPFELDVTELLKDGENVVTIVMLSGNRNLLGPHHKPEGESYSVGPDSFSNKIGWTDNKSLPPWTDNYNFVLFGCEL